MASRVGLGALLVMAAFLATPVEASRYRSAIAPVGIDGSAAEVEATIRRCILAAADVHAVPPLALVILLHVEGGRLGRVSGNTNETVDIGPMQVNEIWLPKLARRWGSTVEQAFLALRDNFCANLDGAAWILRQALDSAGGDFWEGVGRYHSRTSRHKTVYLEKVLSTAVRLEAAAKGTPAGGRNLAEKGP